MNNFFELTTAHKIQVIVLLVVIAICFYAIYRTCKPKLKQLIKEIKQIIRDWQKANQEIAEWEEINFTNYDNKAHIYQLGKEIRDETRRKR